MSAEALATEGARASVGMVLTVYDGQYVSGLLHCEFDLLLDETQVMIRNVNISFIIFNTVQHVKNEYLLLVAKY